MLILMLARGVFLLSDCPKVPPRLRNTHHKKKRSTAGPVEFFVMDQTNRDSNPQPCLKVLHVQANLGDPATSIK